MVGVCGLLAFLLSVTGCGYQFTVDGPGPVVGSPSNRVVEGSPVRLAIRPFRNQSFEPNLEFKYTRYVRQALQSAGTAEITEDESGADFILEGAVLQVTLPSLAFSGSQTQESRVHVRVGVTVKDRTKGRVRWTHTGTGSAEFFVGASSASGGESGLQFNRVLQDRALEQAGQWVAGDISDQFLTARDQGKFERIPKAEKMDAGVAEKGTSTDDLTVEGAGLSPSISIFAP